MNRDIKAQDYFAAFIENSEDIEVLHDVARLLRLENYEVTVGGIKEAIEFYGDKKSPSCLIVDISKAVLPLSALTNLLEVCTPNINIIAIGTANEVSLYRDLNKLGISEYLLCPLFPDILERTLRNILLGEENSKEGGAKAGRIIACMGVRGGVGSTFIASNLAAMLAGEKLRRVVLLDLNPYFGTLSLNFDVKTNPGLRDAFETPGRIDQVFIDRMLTPINERLFILSSEVPFEEKIKYKVEGLEEILKYLLKEFHYVVVDISHSFNDIVSKIILKSNIMVLIMEPSVAGLRDTGRLMRFFHKEGAAHRCILVMNKYGQYEKSELKVSDFEEVIKDKVNHIIAYDNVTPMEFINQGKVMVNENNALSNSIREIMFDILGVRKTKQEVGWFKKLFAK